MPEQPRHVAVVVDLVLLRAWPRRSGASWGSAAYWAKWHRRTGAPPARRGCAISSANGPRTFGWNRCGLPQAVGERAAARPPASSRTGASLVRISFSPGPGSPMQPDDHLRREPRAGRSPSAARRARPAREATLPGFCGVRQRAPQRRDRLLLVARLLRGELRVGLLHLARRRAARRRRPCRPSPRPPGCLSTLQVQIAQRPPQRHARRRASRRVLGSRWIIRA